MIIKMITLCGLTIHKAQNTYGNNKSLVLSPESKT